jgi:hypothetical protein
MDAQKATCRVGMRKMCISTRKRLTSRSQAEEIHSFSTIAFAKVERGNFGVA